MNTIKTTTLTLGSLLAGSVISNAQLLPQGLDFTDTGWTNDKTGKTSEFQTNDAGKGNDAGWDATHSIKDINGSGIGATLSLSHQPHAWNIESRPALASYFPSKNGGKGDILRVWNNTETIKAGEIPSITLAFTSPVTLQYLGLEGYRQDDAWSIKVYDNKGQEIKPNWADPSESASVNPGAVLSDKPINLLTTTGENGAIGAETTSLGTFTDGAFIVRNESQKTTRGAAILNFNNTASVSRIEYSMIEVDKSGTPTGEPSDQSMYIGSGITAKEFSTVPEPSSVALLGLGSLGLLIRRKR